jgi:hypothetical protein
MAKRDPKTGRLSGKISNVVLYTWKGKEVLRALGLPGKRKPTAGQLLHRKRFALASALNRKFRALRIKSFAEEPGQTDASLAQTCIMSAIDATGSDFRIDYSKLKWSRGPLTKPEDLVVQISEAGSVRFQWKPDKFCRLSSHSDRAILVAYCEDDPYPYFEADGSKRFLGHAVLSIPPATGKQYHTWMMFRSDNGKLRSECVYGGVLTS